MDELDLPELTIENADGTPVTATDVLRAIATSKPAPCVHCAADSCRVMGAWIPGDPLTPAERRALA